MTRRGRGVWYFYPRPPRGGRPPKHHAKSRTNLEDFYPRPPRGGRQVKTITTHGAKVFLSTPSARRATWYGGKTSTLRRFLSTPSARRATDHRPDLRLRRAISIHALREEGDAGLPRRHGRHPEISIHALREEGDCYETARRALKWLFLSTPSARRATWPTPSRSSTSEHFYPRPPRGGRPASTRTVDSPVFYFYPRPPRGGRPWPPRLPRSIPSDFYPRPPRGGRPSLAPILTDTFEISIHALREEGDPSEHPAATRLRNFYPRPPRGGRPVENVENTHSE